MTNSRMVKDASGRAWACRQDDAVTIFEGHYATTREGQDVSILCTTSTVTVPVRLTVRWLWMKMTDSELALLITAASPAPTHATV